MEYSDQKHCKTGTQGKRQQHYLWCVLSTSCAEGLEEV